MARKKGDFQSGGNYEVGVRKPFDARQLVGSISDLTSESTWLKYMNDDGSFFNNAYNGMIVAVAEDASVYVLKDRTKLTDLTEGWVKLGSRADTATYFANSTSELPNIGQTETLYIILDKNILMYWDFELLKYIRIGTDWRDVEIIEGGNAEFKKEYVINDYTPSQSV